MERDLKFRDLLALPFGVIGTIMLYLAACIGGEWTADRLLEFIGEASTDPFKK